GPGSLVWQALVLRAELPGLVPGIACAPAWWLWKRQSAAHPTTGWASRKAAKVARAKPRERRVWSIGGKGNRGADRGTGERRLARPFPPRRIHHGNTEDTE